MSRSILIVTVIMFATAALAGCDILGLEDPDLSIYLDGQQDVSAGTVLRVTIDGERKDLRATSDTAGSYSLKTKAPGTGNLDVVVQLLDAAGQTVAQTSFTQRFRDDYNHWVGGYIGTQEPMSICSPVYARAAIAAPYSAPGRDTLFVSYGSIPEDAIC